MISKKRQTRHDFTCTFPFVLDSRHGCCGAKLSLLADVNLKNCFLEMNIWKFLKKKDTKNVRILLVVLLYVDLVTVNNVDGTSTQVVIRWLRSVKVLKLKQSIVPKSFRLLRNQIVHLLQMIV